MVCVKGMGLSVSVTMINIPRSEQLVEQRVYFQRARVHHSGENHQAGQHSGRSRKLADHISSAPRMQRERTGSGARLNLQSVPLVASFFQ